nr:MAG TPA: hypothetical protein [Caudoviricetes sp.]
MQLVVNLSRTFRRHSCAVNQIVVIPQGIAKIHISHLLPIEIIAREGNKSGK